jgi:hypothetical protein
MEMTEKKPYVVKNNVAVQTYRERHSILIQLQTSDPEDFMDRVKNSLVDGEVLQDYSIEDLSGFSNM